MTCIYCGSTPPTAVESEAHIFPYALGGSVSSSDTVCRICNHRVNRDVEEPVLSLFAFLNSLFNIRGRRGDIRLVRASVNIDGNEVTTYLNACGQPDKVLVRPVKNGFLLYGLSLQELEAAQREIAAKRPELKWEEPQEDHVTASIELPEPADVRLRRLAAKVAFEHFALTHGSGLALHSDFNEVRDFILTGDQRDLRSVVVADRRRIFGNFSFPVPSHAAHLVGHHSDNILGSFVTFYGLYHYAVLLSSKYPTLGPIDKLLFEYPDARESHEPRLRNVQHQIHIPWRSMIEAYRQDPRAASAEARDIAAEKLNHAIKEIWRNRSA